MNYFKVFVFALLISALMGAACLPDHKRAQGQKAADNLRGNQPHLPPPSFPVNDGPSSSDRICSGMVVAGTLATCSPAEFCYIPSGQYCGAADYPGVCRPKPEMCTQDYAPVCGCDSKTYSNECAAHAAGVSVMSDGACK